MSHNIESAECKADGEGDWVHCPTCDEDYQVSSETEGCPRH